MPKVVGSAMRIQSVEKLDDIIENPNLSTCMHVLHTIQASSHVDSESAQVTV